MSYDYFQLSGMLEGPYLILLDSGETETEPKLVQTHLHALKGLIKGVFLCHTLASISSSSSCRHTTGPNTEPESQALEKSDVVMEAGTFTANIFNPV